MMKSLKYKWLRFRVVLRTLAKSLDDRMSVHDKELTPYEEKAIRLWKLLLKDKETQMAFSSSGTRQIQRDNVFMIFQSHGNNDHIMTIVDTTEGRRSLYELHIPQKNAHIVCDYFDDEMERRMAKAEKDARSIIENDIDSLLQIEEKQFSNRRKTAQEIS